MAPLGVSDDVNLIDHSTKKPVEPKFYGLHEMVAGTGFEPVIPPSGIMGSLVLACQ